MKSDIDAVQSSENDLRLHSCLGKRNGTRISTLQRRNSVSPEITSIFFSSIRCFTLEVSVYSLCGAPREFFNY